MSNPPQPSDTDPFPNPAPEPQSEPESKPPNLYLLYSLLALALLCAMAFAAAIVWPFYTRR